MSRATTMPSPWREAAEKAGGAGALATALGVGRVAVYRWATGHVEPDEPRKRLVRAAFRRWSLPAPW